MAEEWPSYRVPGMKLVAQNMFRQGAVFVRSAGQVIVVLSVVLWTLGFLGPGSLAERQAMAPSARLETSVLGLLEMPSSLSSHHLVTTAGWALPCCLRSPPARCLWAPSKPSTLL